MLNNNFAFKKVCGDYVVNHLIKNLHTLNIDKLLVGDATNVNTMQIPQLNIDPSIEKISLLQKIAQNSQAQNVILLPAHCLRCANYIIERISSLINNNHIVITSHKRNLSNNIIAFNFDKLKHITKIPTLINNYVKKTIKITTDEEDFVLIDGIKKIITAENNMQNILRQKAINNGALLIDPSTTYLSFDTKIAPGVTIHPNVFIGPNVIIKEDTSILPFSHIEGAVIDNESIIGPFARIRPETNVGKKSVIGNFVEIKNSNISKNVKIKHLSYIGDTKIGTKTNISAGVIICNYDGKQKHETVIEDSCFIGANSSLVAPLYITKNVTVAAGSVITENINEENSLAIARSRQIIKKRTSDLL